MSDIEEVKSYKTTDGELWVEESSARAHQKEFDFRVWLGTLDNEPDLDLVGWLYKYSEEVREFLRDENTS